MQSIMMRKDEVLRSSYPTVQCVDLLFGTDAANNQQLSTTSAAHDTQRSEHTIPHQSLKYQLQPIGR